jgi:NADH-quinone oxidoreductase subunit E/NADP-reducing hydrogenase subunit HndA
MTKITAGPSHSSRTAAIEPSPADSELLENVGEIIADLSPDNASLLTAFHRIQHAYGYVPRETISLLATKFRTTPAMLHGALDFYSEMRTVRPAETTVDWCSGPACLLKGSTNIRRVLEAILGCRMNENTADGSFGLRLVQCDGTCHLAPLVRLHEKYVGPLSVSDAIKLAREIKGQGVAESAADSGDTAKPKEAEEE